MKEKKSEPLEANDKEKPLVPQFPAVPLPREDDTIMQRRVVELVLSGVESTEAIDMATGEFNARIRSTEKKV